ncbi:MAG: FxDxF family PEP-CTERM protein [Caulobacteraceae bacterium]
MAPVRRNCAFGLAAKLGAALAAAAVMSVGAPAAAATIFDTPFYHLVGTTPTYTFAPGDTGQISAYTLTSGEYADVLDFSFDLTPSNGNVLQQLQASLKSGSQAISFDLYSGMPGSGTLVGASATMTGPSFDANLTPGVYYLQIVTNPPAESLISGALNVTAVPEPATWALLLAGFGLVGYAIRRRRVLARFA